MLLTSDLREQLLGTVREWGSGRDTLRCLAMATRDSPPDPRTLNLENSAAFSEYEVNEAEQHDPCRYFEQNRNLMHMPAQMNGNAVSFIKMTEVVLDGVYRTNT